MIVNVYSQTNNGMQAPNIIPKSPEVKGFERYGEYPVSEYTGIPSINIPLHTIKLRDIEFPISLDYHATGIQVTQEATWAGLGWNLMAGGCISTIAIGAKDEVHYANAEDWYRIMHYPFSTTGNSPRIFNEDGRKLWTPCEPVLEDENINSKTPDNILREGMIGSGERDIYNISFLGHSFRVCIHPVDKRIIYNGEKNKFKVEKDGSGWIITDEQGYIYVFSEEESYYNKVSTWYLTHIYYPGFRPLLEIKYASAKVDFLPAVSEYITTTSRLMYDPIALNSDIHRSFNTSSYTQRYISGIVGPMDSIVFTTKSRTDMRGASALDQIVIYDRSTKGEVKRYKFEHDYFTGVNTGASETTFDYVKKRLKLVKLHERNGTQIKGSYQFTYNETALPYKTSFAQDLWGYYNGKENITGMNVSTTSTGDQVLFDKKRTLVPDPVYLSLSQQVPPDFMHINIRERLGNYKLANRSTNESAITAGMLKSITYPTEGRTEFEFEPHTLDNLVFPNPEPSFRTVVEQVRNNGNKIVTPNVSIFEVEKECKAKIKVSIYGKDYSLTDMKDFYVILSVDVASPNHKTLKYSIQTDQQKKEFAQKKEVIIEEEITLPAGKAVLSTSVSAGIPYQGYDFKNGVHAILSYIQDDLENLEGVKAVGGGLRVKSIKNYEGSSTLADKKVYSYANTGKLIYPLCFTQKMDKVYGIITPSANNPTWYMESRTISMVTSYNLYNYAVSGVTNLVGYDRVEKIIIDPAGSSGTGKMISEFINKTSGSAYSHLFYPAGEPYANGKLSSRITLDADNDTVSLVKNRYSIDNMESNHINVNVFDRYEGKQGCPITYPDKRFTIVTYPTNNYTVHLTNQDEITYYGTKKVNKSIAYEYDPLNYRLKKITETIGDKKKATEYRYALNYSSGDFPCQTSMVNWNMVGIPIEELTAINTSPMQSKKTYYSQSGNIIAPTGIHIKNGTGAYELRQTYEYDKYGNPRYITQDDALKTVYIWGYNGQYPIAEIKNVTYTQITAIISANTLESITKKIKPSDADMVSVNNLRTNAGLAGALITTYTYKPLVGILTATDPAGITTYYDYDSFGRLKRTYIKEGTTEKNIQTYDYHYQNQ
jgi:YD repeat-containing protein